MQLLLVQHARPVLALDVFFHRGRLDIRVQLGCNVSGLTQTTATAVIVEKISPPLDI
jgi:hypothetical protein